MTNLNWSKFFRFWFPPILYSGIIFYASSIPNVTTPLQEIHFDKILHFMEYVPFGFLIMRGLCNAEATFSKRTLISLVFVISLVYAISDEFHQLFVSGRNAGIADLILDTMGGSFGGFCYSLLVSKKNK